MFDGAAMRATSFSFVKAKTFGTEDTQPSCLTVVSAHTEDGQGFLAVGMFGACTHRSACKAFHSHIRIDVLVL